MQLARLYSNAYWTLRSFFRDAQLAVGRRTAVLGRRLLSPTAYVIGITGSAGKSTATELTGAVLSRGGALHVAPGSNDLRAIARALRRVRPWHRFYVQEVSGAHPGQIAETCALLRPNVGVVTRVGLDHRSQHRSIESVAQEKTNLVSLLPESGLAILNKDDPLVAAMASATKARVFTYGISPDADLRAEDVVGAWPDTLSMTVVHGGEKVRLTTQLFGTHWVPSVLAAVACGVNAGVPLAACAEAVAGVAPRFNTLSNHTTPDGVHFLADSIKAPFWSLDVALTIFRDARAPRKIAVIGNLSDFAGSASDKYRATARNFLTAGDIVVVVGRAATYVRKIQGDYEPGRLMAFDTTEEANNWAKETLRTGDFVFLKASNTNHIERLLLDRQQPITCWLSDCGVRGTCLKCSRMRAPLPGAAEAA